MSNLTSVRASSNASMIGRGYLSEPIILPSLYIIGLLGFCDYFYYFFVVPISIPFVLLDFVPNFSPLCGVYYCSTLSTGSVLDFLFCMVLPRHTSSFNLLIEIVSDCLMISSITMLPAVLFFSIISQNSLLLPLSSIL